MSQGFMDLDATFFMWRERDSEVTRSVKKVTPNPRRIFFLFKHKLNQYTSCTMESQRKRVVWREPKAFCFCSGEGLAAVFEAIKKQKYLDQIKQVHCSAPSLMTIMPSNNI
ncbi:hypothetical protein RHMOL_Rhmol02G0096800 [Rhododendron molle]|uniref:Uncharacterized protein n=1 Tax=Rhododendron molle TaxID=49168 RepID=A0ACC0PQQ0_RHOML|nr:hypothetical protein RHMOL_Rhmol02G0096800 [Rhododendron molle]